MLPDNFYFFSHASWIFFFSIMCSSQAQGSWDEPAATMSIKKGCFSCFIMSCDHLKKVIFLFYSLPLVGSYSMSVVFSRCSCCSLYSNFCRIFTCFFFPLRIHVSGFSLLLWAIRPTRALQSVAINTTQLMKNNKNATDVKRCEEFIFFFFNE